MNHKKIKDLLHTNDYFYKTKTLELLSNKKYEILKNKAFKYQKTLNILTIIFLIISILFVSYIHYYLDNIYLNCFTAFVGISCLIYYYIAEITNKEKRKKFLKTKKIILLRDFILNVFISIIMIPSFMTFLFRESLFNLSKIFEFWKCEVNINNKNYTLKLNYNFQEFLYKNNKLHSENFEYPSFRRSNIAYFGNKYHYNGNKVIEDISIYDFDDNLVELRKEEIQNKVNNF